MKYIYITIFVLSQFLVSCDDILEVSDDLAELGALNNEALYASEKNIAGVVNGVYAKYASEFYQGGNFLQMTTSNTPYFSGTGSRGLLFGQFDIQASSKNLNDMWVEIYGCVDQANHLIENLNTLGAGFDTTETNLGQGHFLRGITYFDLVRVWGEVPLRIKPATQNTIYFEKGTKQQIYNQIISDLTIATNKLPSAIYQEGRPISYAAHAYLAKVYMNMATETGLELSASEYWDLAYQEAKLVYDANAYSLLPNYADLFAEGNENTAEAIFELQYTAGGTSTKSGQHSTMMSPAKSIFNRRTQGGQVRVNRLALHDHYLDYGVGIADTHPDPRVEATYVMNEYTETVAPNKVRRIYPKQFKGGFATNYIKKYQESTNTNINSEKNRIVFRYADLILMLAEIENERGNYPEAKLYIKEVLDRANTTLYTVANVDGTAGGDDLRDRIMKERVYELLGEGHEWFDLRRQSNGGITFLEQRIQRREALMNGADLFDTKNTAAHHETWNPDLSGVVGDKLIQNLRFPIPTNEIIGNNALTEEDQNIGYN